MRRYDKDGLDADVAYWQSNLSTGKIIHYPFLRNRDVDR